jgi:hypothetical protein
MHRLIPTSRRQFEEEVHEVVGEVEEIRGEDWVGVGSGVDLVFREVSDMNIS